MINNVIHFAGIDTQRYYHKHKLSEQAQAIIKLENNQIPNLRIKKMHNRGFTTDAQIKSWYAGLWQEQLQRII